MNSEDVLSDRLKLLGIAVLALAACKHAEYADGVSCHWSKQAGIYERCIADASCQLTGAEWSGYEEAKALRTACRLKFPESNY